MNLIKRPLARLLAIVVIGATCLSSTDVLAACKKAQQTRIPSGDNIHVGDVDGEGVRVVDIIICDTLPDWPTGTGRFVVGETTSTGGSGVDKPVKKVTIYNRKAPAPGANGKPGGGGTDVTITTIDDSGRSTTESCIEPPPFNDQVTVDRNAMLKMVNGTPTLRILLVTNPSIAKLVEHDKSVLAEVAKKLLGSGVNVSTTTIAAANVTTATPRYPITIAYADTATVTQKCKTSTALCIITKGNAETRKISQSTTYIDITNPLVRNVIADLASTGDTTARGPLGEYETKLFQALGFPLNIGLIHRAQSTNQLFDYVTPTTIPLGIQPTACEKAVARRNLGLSSR